eukprot:m51a1_g2042 hypothetical protein (478) ;mRNA; r:1360928-1362651
MAMEVLDAAPMRPVMLLAAQDRPPVWHSSPAPSPSPSPSPASPARAAPALPDARSKSDEFFVTWLSLQSTRAFLTELLGPAGPAVAKAARGQPPPSPPRETQRLKRPRGRSPPPLQLSPAVPTIEAPMADAVEPVPMSELRGLVANVVATNESLRFLRRDAPEFIPRYIDNVITRIVRSAGVPPGAGAEALTRRALARSPLRRALAALDSGADACHDERDLFCYTDFYVAQRKFRELDVTGAGSLSGHELAAYGGGQALTEYAAARAASLHPIPLSSQRAPPRDVSRMTFSDFVWFLYSEEDRRHPTSVDFWLRVVCGPDGPEVPREALEELHAAVAREAYADPREAPPFRDFLCEALDMVGAERLPVSARSLRRAPLAPLFLGALTSPRVFARLEERREEAIRCGCVLAGDLAASAVTSEWTRWSSAEYARYTASDELDTSASVVSESDGAGAANESWRRTRAAHRKHSWEVLTTV